ncbi:MAG: ROK family protein [Clostridia bacterium]|nr:ROK family protein [Clostridia bacterium]
MSDVYKLGIDLGGTDTKYGVIDIKGNIIFKDIIPTNCESCEKLVDSIAEKCNRLMNEYNIESIGLGVPGIVIDGIVDASNIPLYKVNLKKMLEGRVNVPVKIENDANCAAFGESYAGTGKDVKNIIMLTIGTGIGGGIIIDNKIYKGKGGAGELGHMCIEVNGRPCSCGYKGCWEQYASARALSKSAEIEALNSKDSILFDLYKHNDNKMNGKILFEALKKGCNSAKKAFDSYIEYFVAGLISVSFIFDPDMIVLSGGITNAGDAFINPINEKFDFDIPVRISQLKSDAGIVGAAML